MVKGRFAPIERRKRRREEGEEGGRVKRMEKKVEAVSLRFSNRRDIPSSASLLFLWQDCVQDGGVAKPWRADAGHDCQEHVIRWPSFHMILQIGHPLCRRGT